MGLENLHDHARSCPSLVSVGRGRDLGLGHEILERIYSWKNIEMVIGTGMSLPPGKGKRWTRMSLPPGKGKRWTVRGLSGSESPPTKIE